MIENGGKRGTLSSVGKKYSISKERVRQIVQKVVRRMLANTEMFDQPSLVKVLRSWNELESLVG